MAWYPDTSDPRFSTDRWDLAATGGDWEPVTRELRPHPDATHMNAIVALEAPHAGTRTAFVDDVRLLSWSEPGTTGGRRFDHLRVDGEATVEFVRPGYADGVSWRRVTP